MPTLELLESALGRAVIVEAEGPLIDVCDDTGAPVGFSCRSANCGACRVDVLAGGELLDAPREDELEVLRLLGAAPGQRLACQAVVRSGAGLVRLRWTANEAFRRDPGEA